ncbi:MAG TPA: hypothetical protein VJ246_02875 [Patescibacteria group bacterium]|nr:hypothetical protein [Patescibacteria group bacterium]
MIKKSIASMIPMLIMHVLCCGTMLYFLMTSGYLLFIRQEGEKKVWLIPILVFSTGLIIMSNMYAKKTCIHGDGERTFSQNIFRFVMICLVSLMLSILFMVYLFIPWWIPNYTGGFLLP